MSDDEASVGSPADIPEDVNNQSALRSPEATAADALPEDSGERAGTPDNDGNNSSGSGHDGENETAKDEDEDNDGNESEEMLSDVDEDQFEDYDPATAYIEERPVFIDEEVARGLKSAKRKRLEGEERARKPKEGRREKKRRPGAGAGDDAADAQPGSGEADDQISGPSSRQRKSRLAGKSSSQRKGTPEPEVNEDDLTPEERRKRALNRAIDLAIRNPNKRRRKQDEEDLEKAADEEIAQLKLKMERACMADIDARSDGRPAVNKLQLLPQVLSVLNRQEIQETILDPETNFLQSVKFFLEPLNDGSLPSYTIQRDIFACLSKLPIQKDALLSSGIGRVVLFYTRSKRAEPAIKRMAERLVGEWSRPILKKTDDFKKRHVETAEYDYRAAKRAELSLVNQLKVTQRPISRFEMDKELQLAPPVVNPNRAQPVGLPQSYTIAPKSTFDGYGSEAAFRPIGASSMEAFRRMTQKAKMRNRKK